MPSPLFVFLVSGRPEGGVPHGTDATLANCAHLRVTELVHIFYKNRRKPGAVVQASPVLRFIHFACHDSTVSIYEHNFPTMADRVLRPNWLALDSGFTTAFGSLAPQEDPKNFVEWLEISNAKASHPLSWGEKDRPPGNVSILNVYHSVRKAPPGSVVELSILSHAFVDGPVLNNTYAQPVDLTLGNRTPGDTDGRAPVDFQANMGEPGTANLSALDEFRTAFASNGSFRIWGCNIQDVVETVPPPPEPQTTTRRCLIMSTVRQVVEAGYSRKKKAGGPLANLLRAKSLPPGDTMLSLDMGYQIQYEFDIQKDKNAGRGFTKFSRDRLFQIRYDESFPLNHAYHLFFRGERDANNNFATTITRSLSDIIKFVAAETIPSYVFAAAEALKTVTVIGAPPGASADLDESNPQQHVAVAQLDEANFFSKFFDVSTTEPESDVWNGIQRRYAIFDNQSKAVSAIRDRLTNGIP
jgi:hypothetical protein